jgi:hypothetical protein
MMTGQRSLAEMEAKLVLSDVRYWADHISQVRSIAYQKTYESWDRIPWLLYASKGCLTKPRTKRGTNGRIEGKPRGEGGVDCTVASQLRYR